MCAHKVTMLLHSSQQPSYTHRVLICQVIYVICIYDTHTHTHTYKSIFREQFTLEKKYQKHGMPVNNLNGNEENVTKYVKMYSEHTQTHAYIAKKSFEEN